ncbi:hypothetical protein M0802_001473 [Mischocyttarus mexicanus]|nr:hypothetical protein M0802_001473 [Mischocyttarus mexicanus]
MHPVGNENETFCNEQSQLETCFLCSFRDFQFTVKVKRRTLQFYEGIPKGELGKGAGVWALGFADDLKVHRHLRSRRRRVRVVGISDIGEVWFSGTGIAECNNG